MQSTTVWHSIIKPIYAVHFSYISEVGAHKFFSSNFKTLEPQNEAQESRLSVYIEKSSLLCRCTLSVDSIKLGRPGSSDVYSTIDGPSTRPEVTLMMHCDHAIHSNH